MFIVPWIVWHFRKSDVEPWRSPWVVGMVSAIVLVLYLALMSTVVTSSHSDHSATRLALSVGWAYGYPLYPGPEQGPITCSMYGPVNAFVFSPSAMFSTPNDALCLAATITLFLTMGPLLLLHLFVGSRSDNELSALTGFSFAAAAILVTPPTSEMAGFVHADAPSLGFGLLSCVLLASSDKDPGWTRLGLSALFALMATWAKQVEVAVIPALGIFLWLVHGWGSLVRFIACTFVVGIVSLIVFSVAFGWEGMFFNLFSVPSRHPWIGPAPWAFAMATLELAKPAALYAFIVLAGIVVAGRSARWNPLKASGWLCGQSWFLPLLAAILMIPTSLVGRVKWGGWLNTYHALYYLICAASLVLVQWSRPGVLGRRHVVFSWVLLVSTLLLVGTAAGDLKLLRWIDRPERNPQQQAYEFALKHPGEVYFPWNSLSTLMAEGKLYNMEPGVVDRELAGYRPSDNLFRSHLPDRLRYLAYRGGPESESMREYLPEFSRKVHVDGLAGWNVYTKP